MSFTLPKVFSNVLTHFGLATPKGPYALMAEDVRRLESYKKNWDTYHGADLDKIVLQDATHLPRINYPKRNIDKVNFFTAGLGYTTNHKKYEDNLALARSCWGRNRIEKLTRLLQYGSVTGDAYVMVCPNAEAFKAFPDMTPPSPDPAQAAETTVGGKQSTSKLASDYIKVVVLPSENVRPFYDLFDPDVILYVDIRTPVAYVDSDGTETTKTQLIRISKDTITSGLIDDSGNAIETFESMDNPLKEVYVIHIRNYPGESSVFGQDDIKEQGSLNLSLNINMAKVSEIISYHATPIIAIFGAKAQNLVRSANKVWSNLPVNAKVEAIKTESNLSSSMEHVKTLKTSLHEIAGVPELAQGSQQAISNTSGVALHTMYLPLLERAWYKQNVYGPAIIAIDILVLKWAGYLGLDSYVSPSGEMVKVKPITTPEEFSDLRDNTEIEFESPLPKDALIAVQVETAKLTGGLTSKRRAMTILGVKDVETVKKEIKEDQKETAETMKMMAVEPAKDGTTGVDTDAPKVESGASATTGTNTSESDTQKGRPKGSGSNT